MSKLVISGDKFDAVRYLREKLKDEELLLEDSESLLKEANKKYNTAKKRHEEVKKIPMHRLNRKALRADIANKLSYLNRVGNQRRHILEKTGTLRNIVMNLTMKLEQITGGNNEESDSQKA